MEEENKEKHFTFVDKRKRYEEENGAREAGSPSEGEPEQPQAPAQEARPSASAGEEAEAPPIDFATFILSLSSSAAYHMGGFQDPVSGKTSVNLDLAKQTIDIIAMLEDKTKGNLTEDESRLISHVLYDLRMRFVEVSSHKPN